LGGSVIDLESLLATGCASVRRIGIGLRGEMLSSTASLLGDRGCGGVELVGYDDPSEMSQALLKREIDGGVRGTMSSKDVLGELRDAYGLDRILRTAVLGSADGRAFLLTPVGIDEGRTMDQRTDLVLATIDYLRPTGWSLKVGVLSKGRTEDDGRGEDIRRSLEEGVELAGRLRANGIDAKHHGILVEEAARECDLLVAPDGVTGNLMFRALHFVGAGRAYGAPVLNLPGVFVDTSRAKEDFVEPVLLAAGLSKLGCGRAGGV
jgi:putative methanogen marker protein 4